MTTFIDTRYLLALELARDQNHQAATQHWRRVSASPLSLITTSYVFDEVVTFFNSRDHHAKAVQVGNALLHSPSARVIHVDTELFYEAWTYFQKFHDKDYSFTDCVSFVVMEKFGIHTAFTFDKHFAQAGFVKEP